MAGVQLWSHAGQMSLQSSVVELGSRLAHRQAQAQDLDDGDDDAPAMFTAAGAAIADDFLGFGSPPAVAADGAASYSEGDGASATEFDDAAKTPADTYAASTAGGEEASARVVGGGSFAEHFRV